MSKNTGTSELINYFDLGANGDVGIAGSLDINTIANATTDTDTFLVSDTGIIKYRTGAQLLSDIGAAPAVAGGYVPYTGAGANVDLGIYNLTASAVTVNGSGSNSGIVHLESNAIHSLVNGYGSIASGTTNQFNLYQTTGAGVFRGAILSLNSITASATRTFTLPDADGTLALTSSLGAYLPLAGGTLTGALNGTSASFTGAVTSDDLILTAGTLFGAGNTGFSNRLSDTTLYLQMPATGFNITDNALNTRFILASTGAATFSSSVTADSLIIANNDARIRNNDATGRIIIGNSSTNTFAIFYGTSHPTQANQTVFANGGLTTCTFSSTGAATFSSSVTATAATFVKVDNGTQAIASFAANNLSQQVDIWYAGVRAGGTSTNVDLYLSSKNAGSLVCETNGAERMRITSGGDVYLGNSTLNTVNTAIFFEKAGGDIIQVFPYSSGSTVLQYYYRQNGALVGSISYNGSLILFNGSSDYRLKEDLQDFNGLDIVGKLKTYNFNWIDPNVRDYGMIAHELQEVLPNYVNGEKDAVDKDGNIIPQGVDYSKIVPILVKAIQEQQVQIQELKNKLS